MQSRMQSCVFVLVHIDSDFFVVFCCEHCSFVVECRMNDCLTCNEWGKPNVHPSTIVMIKLLAALSI